MSILLKSLSYVHSDKEVLFQQISFTIPKGEKAALIGHNGSGKSTLLKLIAGRLSPSGGEVLCSGTIWYIPQHFGQYDALTVAQALGIEEKLRALHSILNGEGTTEHLTILNDDWQIEERVKSALASWNLPHVEIHQPMDRLSGGEKTKVFLSGLNIHTPEIILFDEPTNHLDTAGREQLYQFIENSKATLLLVSHDRTLLNLVQLTLELKKGEIEAYGGNYDLYEIQKEEKLNALYAQLHEKEKSRKEVQQKSRGIAEQKQKNDARGKKRKVKAGTPRIVMNTLKNTAEKSSAKLKTIQSEKLQEVSVSIQQVREEINEEEVLKIDLKSSTLHSGKMLIEAKEFNFSYGEKSLWKEALSFQLRSGERIRIAGKNGSGKTTLLGLLMKTLQPSAGELFHADFNFLYIDQEYSLIKNELTVYEQVHSFNDRQLPEHDLKMYLNRCRFPADMWHRQCDHLSGGEKMKLILCCLVIRDNMPDLLILDEPTNNLDLQSQKILTTSIREYNGTLIVISHDEHFIEEIKTERVIEL